MDTNRKGLPGAPLYMRMTHASALEQCNLSGSMNYEEKRCEHPAIACTSARVDASPSTVAAIDIDSVEAQNLLMDPIRSAASAWPYALIRPVAIIGIALLCGCSWFLPHPESSSNVIGDADTPRDGRCSLAVAQHRKSLPGQIVADGVPTPLVIHMQFSIATNREIKSGQSIYFEASSRDADPPRNFGPDMSRHSSSPSQPIPQPLLWRIEGVDPRGTVIADNAVLMEGSLFELREPEGSSYLLLETKAANVAVPRGAASRFILYKADVPDPTRVTTCDEEIRDGDFVFVRTLAPSAWVNVASPGILRVQQFPAGSAPSPAGSNSNPRCAREEERCHVDRNGGLVCVWAPVCGD